MRKLITSSLLAAMVVLLSLNASAATKTYIWNVKWYKIDEISGNFTKYLGCEKWKSATFYKDWEREEVYDGYYDFVGFIATAEINSIGKNYTFDLYNVDNKATVYLDGQEILNSSSLPHKTVNMYIPPGKHEIKIVYMELCCVASIGFSVDDETIFVVKKEESKTGIPGYTVGIAIAAIGGTAITFIMRRK